MTFSIQFCLDPTSSERIEALWPLIGPRCVSNGTNPHISVLNFEDPYPDNLVLELGAFASQEQPVPAEIALIGVAKTYRSIMMLPVVTRELLNLHQRVSKLTRKLGILPLPFYEVGHWMPHITIADETDFDNFDAALQRVLESDFVMSVEIQSVRLIEFKPCREICCFKLAG